MQSVVKTIIFIFGIFSSLNWYASLEKTFDLKFWIEDYILFDQIEVKSYNFYNEWAKNAYEDFIKKDEIIRQWIISKARNWDLPYYKLSKSVDAYKNFVYHTNEFFYYVRLSELWNDIKNDAEMEYAIEENYKKMRVYLTKLSHYSS